MIKRYKHKLSQVDYEEFETYQVEAPDGEWVKYEDMLKLVEEAFAAGFNHCMVENCNDDLGDALGWFDWKKANLGE